MRIATVVAAAAFLSVEMQAARPRLPLGLELYRPVPSGNRLTPKKIALGRRLFFDRRLSRDGSLSCAGCHDPKRALTDGRVVAQGVGGAKGNPALDPALRPLHLTDAEKQDILAFLGALDGRIAS